MKLAAVAAAVLFAAAGAGGTPRPADDARVRAVAFVPRAAAAPVPTQWCGTTAPQSSADRLPDAAAGHQIHYVYAFPQGGSDRFLTFASGLASDVAAIDQWWRRQDPTRAPRVDLTAFPGCTSTFGNLDITRLQLPQPSAYYEPLNSRLERLIEGVRAAGLDNEAKKYHVFYDGPVGDPGVCGISFLVPLSGGAEATSMVFLGSHCGFDVGGGAVHASVLAHELTHNLGAVYPLPPPPHLCSPVDPHVCDNENDLMYPTTRGQGLDALTLDVGRDDYYGHGVQGRFDIRTSPWLSRLDVADFRLVVTSRGRGSVTADLPGLACPPQCSATFEGGTLVTLTAAAEAGATFRGWSGACAGLGPCRVLLDAAKSVTARFASPVRVRVRIAGGVGGAVASRPAVISCPPACTAVVDSDTRLVLRATPRRDARFAGWSGGCRGSRPTCALTPSESVAVTAIFRRR